MYPEGFMRKVIQSLRAIDEEEKDSEYLSQEEYLVTREEEKLVKSRKPVDKRELLYTFLAAFFTYLPAIIVLIVVIALALINYV